MGYIATFFHLLFSLQIQRLLVHIFTWLVDMTLSLTRMRPFFKYSCGKIWALSPKLVEFMAIKPKKLIVNGEE